METDAEAENGGVDTGREEGEGERSWDRIDTHVHHPVYSRELVGTCRVAQKNSACAL